MNIRILLTIVVLFFLSQPLWAQDTVKHAAKHIHKTHINDSAQVAHSKHDSHIKDTSHVLKKRPVVMPKYPRDGYVAVMGGLCLPLAAYASNAGAATGSDFSISAAFPGITSHSGIAFKFDHGINGFNQSRLEGIENTVSGFSNISCTFPNGLGHYSYSSYLTGLYVTYPKKHITIDLRFLAGVMVANIPDIDITYYDEIKGNSGINYQGATTASAFAFDLGFELRYPFKPRFCIILSADYLHAVPSFTMVNTGSMLSSYGSIETNSEGTEVTTNQPFNLFNLSVGIGYVISAQKRVVPKAN